MALNDKNKHAVALLKKREAIVTEFKTFKTKVDEIWTAVREAYNDKQEIKVGGPEVAIVLAWPDRVKTLVMIEFADWLSNYAVALFEDYRLDDNDTTLDLRISCEVSRNGQTALVLLYDDYSGLKYEHDFSFVEIAGMLAAGYDFHSNNPTFFIK